MLDLPPEGAPIFLQFKRKLGYGSYSEVWLAYHTRLRTEVAVKVIAKADVQDPAEQTRLVREIEIHRKLDHPNIIKIIDVCVTLLHHFIIMEYAAGVTLLDKLIEVKKFTEVEAKRYFSQLVSAVSYLHNTLKIAHRDLKLENIMLDENDVIKLIDFGFSKCFDRDDLVTPLGSPKYVSPELFDRKPYTKACDIWGLGIILFACVTGRHPFQAKNMAELSQQIRMNNPVVPNTLSHPLQQLLMGMLRKNPILRYTITDIGRHPWLGETGFTFSLQSNPMEQVCKFRAKEIPFSFSRCKAENATYFRGF